MGPRQQQVLFILEVLQGLVAESYDDEIPELKEWFNKVESDDENTTLLEQLSSGTWCVSLAAVEIKVEHLTRSLGLLGELHEAKHAISLNLMSKGESEEEVEGLLGDDWVFAHVLHMCVPAPEAIVAEYEARDGNQKQILSLILPGKTGLLLIPQKCDEITTDRLCKMIADGEFQDCAQNFGDSYRNRTKQEVKAAFNRESIVELADGFVEMSPEELADWINNRDVHDVNLTRISQAMDIVTQASPVDKTDAIFRAMEVYVPQELLGADIQQTLANLADAEAAAPGAEDQLDAGDAEQGAAAEFGADE